jgi:hypothetical protein
MSSDPPILISNRFRLMEMTTYTSQLLLGAKMKALASRIEGIAGHLTNPKKNCVEVLNLLGRLRGHHLSLSLKTHR